MTIYTLYKKTHLKTGLKYLGYTKQNPYTYKGSGKHWRHHIDAHGYDVETEILFQTKDKNDIKPVGIYYSNLWNVVESKEWANLKLEEGDGGSCPASGQHMKLEKYKEMMRDRNNQPEFKKALTQRMLVNNPMNKLESREKIGDKLRGKPKSENHKANMYKPMLDPAVSSKRKGKNNPCYNNTRYCWEHKDSKERLYLTQWEFLQQVGSTRGHINNVARGRAPSVKGYFVIRTP